MKFISFHGFLHELLKYLLLKHITPRRNQNFAQTKQLITGLGYGSIDSIELPIMRSKKSFLLTAIFPIGFL